MNGSQDEIRCHFEAHQASSPPEYEALSYVWGDPARTLPLISEGKQILITTTLDIALRQLRLPQTVRVLWVDQLCINQDDLDERSQQVQLMKFIYSKARRVLVWLGRDDEMRATDAKELIENIENVWCDDIGSSRFPRNEDLEKRGLPPQEASCWSDLQRMLDNPYFQRIWVVQECRVASDLLLLWGTEEISWREFFHTISWAFKNCAFVSDNTVLSPKHGRRRLNLDAQILISGTNLGHNPDNPDDPDWLWLLMSTGSHKASDCRDKLFVLLGLFGESGPSIKPDYRKSSSEVFSELVSHMIPRMQTLQLLSFADLTSLDRFPLWAPRWVSRESVKPLQDYDFKASGTMTPIFRDTSSWEILVLEGLLLDHVDLTTLPLMEDILDNSFSSRIKDAWDLVNSRKPQVERAYPESRWLIVAFIWTLTAGHTVLLGYPVGKPADASHLLDFAAYQVNYLLLYTSRFPGSDVSTSCTSPAC